MTERWLPCPDYEGIYEVSDLGRVRRVVAGKGTRAGRVLKTRADKHGYPYLNLTVKGVCRTRKVHILVCRAFHGEPVGDDVEVAHKNGRPPDCWSWNLRWSTHAENMADKNLHGTHNKGERHSLALLRDDDIPEIRRLLASGLYQKDVAKMYGVHRSTINNISIGKNWNHV